MLMLGAAFCYNKPWPEDAASPRSAGLPSADVPDMLYDRLRARFAPACLPCSSGTLGSGEP